MQQLEYKFCVDNTRQPVNPPIIVRQPVNPAGKTYNFGMQQLENEFVVDNARQPESF